MSMHATTMIGIKSGNDSMQAHLAALASLLLALLVGTRGTIARFFRRKLVFASLVGASGRGLLGVL